MNIIVTGGAGFVGSHLVERLVNEGSDVTVIDNLHTGRTDNLKNVANRIKFFNAHVGDIAKIDMPKVDKIYHLGMYSSSPMYRENHSLVGTVTNEAIAILEFAKKNNARVVFASSSSLYNGVPAPHREDVQIKPTDYYTEARYSVERFAEFYQKYHNVSSTGLRPFSIYGPREQSKGVYANIVSQFLWTMQKGEGPVIYGDGTQTRDFIYVDDMVDAFVLAMKSGKTGIYNAGTGRSHSFNDVIDVLNEALGTKIKATHIPNPINNYVPSHHADITKAERELGFKAKYDLMTGVKNILAS